MEGRRAVTPKIGNKLELGPQRLLPAPLLLIPTILSVMVYSGEYDTTHAQLCSIQLFPPQAATVNPPGFDEVV